MQITVRAEKFGIVAKPKLTRAMFDWFWANFWKVRNNVLGGLMTAEKYKIPVETIDIRINRSLPWTDYHFYITINGVHNYYFQGGDYEFEKFQREKLEYAQKYDWGKEYQSRKKHFFEYLNLDTCLSQSKLT